MGFFLQRHAVVSARTSKAVCRFRRLSGLGLRFYSPGSGRWCSRDPVRVPPHVGQNLQEMSLAEMGVRRPSTETAYRFVDNSPLVCVDVLGLDKGTWPSHRASAHRETTASSVAPVDPDCLRRCRLKYEFDKFRCGLRYVRWAAPFCIVQWPWCMEKARNDQTVCVYDCLESRPR